LIVAAGDTVDTVQNCTNAILKTVEEHIRVLGLRLTINKMESVMFTSGYETDRRGCQKTLKFDPLKMMIF